MIVSVSQAFSTPGVLNAPKKNFMNETIGQQLQKTRLEHKQTLQEAAFATHIRLHYLEALEQDQRHLLPSDVQGRGFLRLYAGYLDLDAQPLLDAWDGNNIQPSAQEPTPAKEPPRRRLLWRREPIVETLPPEGAPAPDEDEDEEADAPAVEEVAPAELANTLEPQETATAPPVPDEVEITAQPESTESTAVTFEEIFQEIGQELRKRRESLSLKISDIERFTHIRYRYVEALEKGLIDELPSPVQGRGMLNNYARFIDLDSERILLRFADGLQARRKEYVSVTRPQERSARRRRPTQPTTAGSWRRFFTPDLLIGGAVILFLFGFAIWGASQVSTIRQQNELANAGEATLAPVANIMLTVSPAPDETPTVTIVPTVRIIEPGAPVSGAGNSAQVNEEVPAVDNSSAGAGSNSQPTLDVQVPEGSNPLQLYIVANQRAYLKIVADKKEVFNGRVIPGNAYQFSGQEQVELLTGNAAALQVFFNQTDLGTLGSVGEVVSLVFNKQGLTTPTPAFTATATATNKPTPTIVFTGTARPLPTSTVTPYIP